jgi:hypothetical protein
MINEASGQTSLLFRGSHEGRLSQALVGSEELPAADHGRRLHPMARGFVPANEGYSLRANQTTFEPGRPLPFRFQILGPDGKPVTAYRLLHERELHLIVARRDLATFSHLHPDREPDGTWLVELTLPSPGPYRAFADVAPSGGPDLTLSIDLMASGEWVSQELPPPSRTEHVEDYEVELSGELAAGAHSELSFRVSRGGPLVQLEPYLGALGHLVALRPLDLTYLHVHPLEGGSSDTVSFGVGVPSPGPYRLFLQFLHGGQVHTVAFTVEADGGGRPETPAVHAGHEHG